jgi:surface antigen
MSFRALLVSLLALVTGLVLLPASPAAAEVILCKGFRDCNAKGYTNYGYEKVYRQMWWRMYGGHNCTNYAAYRMVQAGLSTERPWTGSGNASNWGRALSAYVDDKPMVGAIAWWKNRNHVQVVEQVLGPKHIIVSEDHWGGDFNWADVWQRRDGRWPDGFIHLRDAKVENSVRASIPGTPKVGQPVKVDTGTWAPDGTALTTAWLANGRTIAGTDNLTTYTPKPADAGKELSVRVIGKKYGYVELWRNSPRSPAVQPGDVRVTAAPRIEGLAKVGSTLTATPATFSPAVSATTVQWFADGVPVPGANDWQLELGAAEANKRITVSVTGTRTGYAPVAAESEPTAPVGPKELVVTEEPTLTGSPQVDGTLQVAPGRVDEKDARVTTSWLRDGTPIKGASALTYRPTPSDVGARIGARVTFSKPGYRTVAKTVQTPSVVKTVPVISYRSPNKNTLTVWVKSQGVSPVPGKVTLWHAGQKKVVALKNQRAVFRAKWIGPGWGQYNTRYEGSDLVAKGTHKQRFYVLRNSP